MEAVARHAERSGVRRLVGSVLVGVGAVLLLASGAYYAYGAWAGSRLDEFNVARERPAPLETRQPGAAAIEGAVVLSGPVPASDTPAIGANRVEPLRSEYSSAAGVAAPAATESPSAAASAPTAATEAAKDIVAEKVEVKQAAIASAGVQFEQGTAAGPKNLARNVERTEPLGVGKALGPKPPESTQAEVQKASSDSVVSLYQEMVAQDPRPGMMAKMFEATKAEAATYASPSLADLSGVGLGPATRIRIPVLNIDSEIKELEVVRTADSSAWETPKHIVGHIPTTPVPGGDGQGWYFGHLESPIRGEGNVFQRLPEIAKLLEREDTPPIYIFLESKDRKFVYQVYRTEGMPREELRISDSGAEDITLVTCTPRFVYDQRLLVTAALVGVLDT